ncbi:MAG: pyridoxamine 5'-phosphate oxidase family protein [Candidatus Binatia bacterium]
MNPPDQQRITLNTEAREFLDAHVVGHLATADSTGAPHVIPVCFARVDDRLYFVADEKAKRHGPLRLKRLANIRENPRAALVVDDYNEDWQRLAFLLLHLEAALVTDWDEYQVALSALRARYPAYRSMALAPESHPMVRLTTVSHHLWRAARARV